MANRHAAYPQSVLAGERLARPVDLHGLKAKWLAARERAEQLIRRLPEEELGCLYLDPENRPVTPDPGESAFAGLRRHYGSIRGAWPSFA